MVTPDADGCLKWRLDADISNSKLQHALANLKARNSVIIPIATPARIWAEGDPVLAQGARGVFWWAKVTACHMDGTYTVFVFDDSPSGGQQWEHLVPMYLRPRTANCERPTGIACRPSLEIPQWGDDDRSAFDAAVKAKKTPRGTFVSILHESDDDDDDDDDEHQTVEQETQRSAHSGCDTRASTDTRRLPDNNNSVSRKNGTNARTNVDTAIVHQVEAHPHAIATLIEADRRSRNASRNLLDPIVQCQLPQQPDLTKNAEGDVRDDEKNEAVATGEFNMRMADQPVSAKLLQPSPPLTDSATPTINSTVTAPTSPMKAMAYDPVQRPLGTPRQKDDRQHQNDHIIHTPKGKHHANRNSRHTSHAESPTTTHINGGGSEAKTNRRRKHTRHTRKAKHRPRMGEDARVLSDKDQLDGCKEERPSRETSQGERRANEYQQPRQNATFDPEFLPDRGHNVESQIITQTKPNTTTANTKDTILDCDELPKDSSLPRHDKTVHHGLSQNSSNTTETESIATPTTQKPSHGVQELYHRIRTPKKCFAATLPANLDALIEENLESEEQTHTDLRTQTSKPTIERSSVARATNTLHASCPAQSPAPDNAVHVAPSLEQVCEQQHRDSGRGCTRADTASEVNLHSHSPSARRNRDRTRERWTGGSKSNRVENQRSGPCDTHLNSDFNPT